MTFLPEKRALEILGGEQREDNSQEAKIVKFMTEGAGYWNVPDKEKWKGVFNHIMLEYNAGIHIAKRLKRIGEEKNIDELKNIDGREAATAALLSDIGKRRAEEAIAKGETKEDTHGQIGKDMLEKAGFSETISRIASSHDFPTSKDQLPTIYDKIALFADAIAGQKYMLPSERLHDIEQRWITQRKEQGKNPLINEDKFEQYRQVVQEVADEIFGLLGEDPEEFIRNIPHSREERYLRALFDKNLENRGIQFADNLYKEK
ncbi:MAG: HD domain-containing protein [Patescibacteria group bacterium]|nr:HD domain-containing protein [Patescibacteria group bacterium]